MLSSTTDSYLANSYWLVIDVASHLYKTHSSCILCKAIQCCFMRTMFTLQTTKPDTVYCNQRSTTLLKATDSNLGNNDEY